MRFIKGDPKIATGLLSARIIKEIKAGKSVLWLLSGGSNIPISANVLKNISQEAPECSSMLSLTLMDERYGPLGHKDSNWKQFEDAGFDFGMVKNFPILRGSSIKDTAKGFESDYLKSVESADVVIGQFGIGEDCHIAGALPGTVAAISKKAVEYYETPKFARVTLTPEALKGVDVAFVFAFGASKKGAIEAIKSRSRSTRENPALILWDIEDSVLVSDQA